MIAPTLYEVRWLGSRASDAPTVLYSGPDHLLAIAIALDAGRTKQGHTYVKTITTAVPAPSDVTVILAQLGEA